MRRCIGSTVVGWADWDAGAGVAADALAGSVDVANCAGDGPNDSPQRVQTIRSPGAGAAASITTALQ